MYYMGNTMLNVRVDDGLVGEVRRRAEEEGVSVSEWVRAALGRAVREGELRERLSAVKGVVDSRESEKTDDAWTREIRERNWRR